MPDKKTSEENAAPLPLDGSELVRVSVGDSSGHQSAQCTTRDIADLSYVDITTAVQAARTPNIQSVASASTVTPNGDPETGDDMVKITAQAAGLTLANPSGSPAEGQGMVVRIKDNGTARGITYGSQYRAIGVTLPTTTVISKTLYLGMVFNSTDTKWDVVAVAQQA
jgi:hypothetical protein